MSGMQGTTWVYLLVAGVILWLAAHGRLSKLVDAMKAPGASFQGGSGGSSSGSGTGQPLSGQNPFAPNAVQPNGWGPNANIFGLTGVNSYAYGETYGNMRSEDQAGLTAAGGGALAHDYDYGVPGNEYVSLPGTGNATYTLVKQYWGSGYGWLQSWKAPNGGIFEYVHLTTPLPASDVGKTFSGGQVVGVSGEPLSISNGYGKHLAVIADTAADQYLRGIN